MSGAVFVLSLIGLMFIVFGILIKYFKCYWLISGYNTSSEERKKKVDIDGLGRLMGNFCFFLGGIFLILGILSKTRFSQGMVVMYPIIFISAIVLIIKAQKYDSSPNASRNSKIIALCLGAFFILTFGMVLYGARETKVVITPQAVRIEGTYGENLEMGKISEIVLADSIPKVNGKVNGFDFGKVLKGNFSLEGLGTCKIYIHYEKPPYIHIKYGDDDIFINQRDKDSTQGLYYDMIKYWNKK